MHVQLNEVSKDFGPVRALDSVSLTLDSGQRSALIGPNGAGKSTLTRILMGMMDCRGAVRLDGMSPHEERARLAPRLAYVPQIAPRLGASVGEMVRAVSRLRGLSASRVENSCAELGLSFAQIRRKPFRDLSGGMRQKLLLALALSSRSDLLIMDEPTASLDATTRRRFFELIDDLPGTPTVLLCSHRLEEIRNLVGTVIMLENGRLVFDDTAASFLARRSSSTIELRIEAPGAHAHLSALGFRKNHRSGVWIRRIGNDERCRFTKDLLEQLGPAVTDLTVTDEDSLDLEVSA